MVSCGKIVVVKAEPVGVWWIGLRSRRNVRDLDGRLIVVLVTPRPIRRKGQKVCEWWIFRTAQGLHQRVGGYGHLMTGSVVFGHDLVIDVRHLVVKPYAEFTLNVAERGRIIEQIVVG